MPVNGMECSLSLGPAVMYLHWLSPGNDWESNLALFHCTKAPASFHPCIRNFLLPPILCNTVALHSFFKASL